MTAKRAFRTFPDVLGEKFCRMAATLCLPQIPQLLEIVPNRFAAALPLGQQPSL
jgi:hypothetical protein